MKKMSIFLLVFVIVAVPVAFATTLTVNGVTLTTTDALTVHTSSDLPFVFDPSHGLTQEFNAFDISSNPTWLGPAAVTAAFTFLPPASSGPLTGAPPGAF